MFASATAKRWNGFEKLSDASYVYLPPADSRRTEDDSELHLAILATWYAAAPRHIIKYVETYKRLYPKARILVITCSIADMSYRSDSVQQRRLSPAVEAIRLVLVQYGNVRILLHLFSNGGANTSCQLAAAFLEATNSPLPLSAMILDSTPGRPEMQRSVNAITAHLSKNLLLFWTTLLLVYTLVLVIWILDHVFGIENVLDRNRRSLNTGSLFPLASPRCYLYSQADEMVASSDIESHADQAEAIGWPVDKVRFENSAHVSHVAASEDSKKRYWDAVNTCMIRKNYGRQDANQSAR